MSPYEDIVIGLSLPKTGRYAPKAGIVYERAYNLWLKERWGSSDSVRTAFLPGP